MLSPIKSNVKVGLLEFRPIQKRRLTGSYPPRLIPNNGSVPDARYSPGREIFSKTRLKVYLLEITEYCTYPSKRQFPQSFSVCVWLKGLVPEGALGVSVHKDAGGGGDARGIEELTIAGIVVNTESAKRSPMAVQPVPHVTRIC